VLARAGGENFPVALRVLPPRWRRALTALYGFARLVDEAGDAAGGDRAALLDAVEQDLARVFAGGEPRHPLLRVLGPVVREHGLRREPFARLIEANRRDQRITRYATWGELLDYCAHSANPVGEWVLGVAGAATPERLAWSDAICSALQVIEHCQDVAEDHAAGRVYLPQEDLRRAGCAEKDLACAPASPALRRALALSAARARRLLERGAPLPGSLQGPARLAVAAFVGAGHAALDALERADFDVTSAPVRAGKGARLRAALRAWRRVR
jgi:squalene synthase HpnC